MSENGLYRIPIYARTFEEHQKGVSRYIERLTTTFTRGFELPENEIQQFQDGLRSRQIPWQYNGIVGWIEIRLEFENLKAYLFRPDAVRINRRSGNRGIKYFGKLQDVCFDVACKTNEEIRDEILSFIEEVPKRKDFKR